MNEYIPAISVIMPVYNTAPYLKESIDSILTQTFRDFEFIIINDGSTDNSEEIILGYHDSRIRYIRNEINRGYVFSLNRALELARGTYIARLDSDDVSFPDRLSKQYAFMETHPGVIICGCGFRLFGATDRDSAYTKDFLLSLLTAQFLHSAVFFRNAYFKKHNLKYDESATLYEDYKLWAEIYIMNHYNDDCFYNLKEVLVKYRVHPYQVSNRFRVEQYMGSMQVRRKFVTDFLRHFKFDFQFSDAKNLVARDIKAIERIFSKFNKNELLKEQFSVKALDEFKSLAIYWLYLSYPEKSPSLLFRFLGMHMKNMGITPQEKLKVFFHLAFGREYKRRF